MSLSTAVAGLPLSDFTIPVSVKNKGFPSHREIHTSANAQLFGKKGQPPPKPSKDHTATVVTLHGAFVIITLGRRL